MRVLHRAKNMSYNLPLSAILAVAVTKFFRKAEKEGKNTLFYRDTGKNIHGDSFHPGGKRYWR